MKSLLRRLALPLAPLVGLALLGLTGAGPARLHLGPWEFQLSDEVAEASPAPVPVAPTFPGFPHEGTETSLHGLPVRVLAVPGGEPEGIEGPVRVGEWLRGYFLAPSACPEGAVRRPSFPGWSDAEILERIYRIEAARSAATVS